MDNKAAYQSKVGASGLPIYEEKKQAAQKNSDYLSEWKQQI